MSWGAISCRMLVAWTCTPLPKVLDQTPYLVSGVDITERARQQEELDAAGEPAHE